VITLDKAKHQQMCDHCYDQFQEAVMQEVLGEDEEELPEDSEPTEEGTPSAGGVITARHCIIHTPYYDAQHSAARHYTTLL